MRRVCRRHALLTQGLGAEAHVVRDVQGAGAVLLVEGLVGLGVCHRIAPAELHGELAPRKIGVQGQQGVIEVKQGQFHSFSSMVLSKGMVMARWVRKA